MAIEIGNLFWDAVGMSCGIYAVGSFAKEFYNLSVQGKLVAIFLAYGIFLPLLRSFHAWSSFEQDPNDFVSTWGDVVIALLWYFCIRIYRCIEIPLRRL